MIGTGNTKMAAQQQFGPFLRTKRAALGLSLREFCRRAGLDPGNVSRIERRKLSPPKSEEALSIYADALKLTAADRRTFFELAALETGRIPPAAAASPEARQRLFRAVRAEPRRVQPWVNAVDLQQWADYQDARRQFPRLVRRLIRATNQTIQRIGFPAGEGSERHGWDGIVMAGASTDYVPAGLSVWELGTSRDPVQKARRDSRKRTERLLGVDPANATFVMVTPRRLRRKKSLEQRENDRRFWKEVRVYDVDDLEAWLELAPSVDIWFARLIGKRAEGVQDIDEYWESLSALTEPKLKPGVFLASREEEIKALEKWLAGPASVLAIEARSPAESIDFVAAYLAQLGAAERDAIAARALIVENPEAWQSLTEESSPLILVAKVNLTLDAELAAQAVRKGHHVLLSSHHFSSGRTQPLKLSRPNLYDLEKALTECGFTEAIVRRSAKDCGGSLAVLKRRLPSVSSTTEPAWSSDCGARALAILSLIGSWEEQETGDRAVVERLTGRAYSEFASDLQRWFSMPDPPVLHVLSRWSLTSREDSWLLLARYLTDHDLDAWEDLAVDVLSHDDPQFDLPADERRWARMGGAMPRYSRALRTGISETLALLATRGDELRVYNTDQSFRINRIIERVLAGNPGWKRWATLGEQLPLLAEAGPETFLAALEADLHQPSPALLTLFEDSGDPLLSTCLHAGLLWALETLAWNPEVLTRVSLVLAGLAESDRGKRWANRPGNSLVEIFLPWLPQTTAAVDRRIAALRKITQKHPDVGWKLLLSLLPKIHGVSHPTHRPAWRDWAAEWSRGASNSEYFRKVGACGEELLEMVGSDVDRWLALIDRLANLPDKSRSDAIDRLLGFDLQTLGTDERTKITDAIRAQVARHRGCPNARWALPPKEVERLEMAAKHIEPDDPVARHAWLFAQWPKLPDGDELSDQREQRIASERQKALCEVASYGGLDAVIRLAATAEDASAVGAELARANEGATDTRLIPALLDDSSRALVTFARGYANARFRSQGWCWVETLPLADWTADRVASLALALPPVDRSVWSLVERQGPDVCRRYWASVSIFSVRDQADLRYVTSMLLQHGRPFTAVHLLAMELHRRGQVDAELVTSVLEAGVRSSDVTEEPSDNIGHNIQELFRHLQSSEVQVEERRLACLEEAYLDVLDGHPASPQTLHRLLAADPNRFVNLLRSIFRSTHDSESVVQEPTEEMRRRARNAYSLLHSWEVLPGLDENTKTVDERALAEWVARARELCRESGHSEIGDVQIGELLAHSPPEADGTWPCIPVRDVIEDADSEALAEGFVVGRLNQRGVVCKSPFDGGDEERALAAEYVEHARACEAEWPRTAAALRQIAQHYEHDARREDDEAEARRIGR